MADLPRLFSELTRLETELWNAVDARLRAAHDLPLSWFEPMQVVDRRHPCRVIDIAEELRITVGGTSKLVDRIEGAGFIRRRPNPDDRRSSVIELTSQGRRVLKRATVSFEDELARQLGGALPGRKLDELTATLAQLRRSLAVEPGARGNGDR